MSPHTGPGSEHAGEVVGEREAARRRVQAKREFAWNIVAYAVVNIFLVGVWAISGAGYFWPAWVICGWGVAVVLHGWHVFLRPPVTDADIDAELRRHHR
jgi:protein-S-isoprenylcysteine O-methyltransferase Ste14